MSGAGVGWAGQGWARMGMYGRTQSIVVVSFCRGFLALESLLLCGVVRCGAVRQCGFCKAVGWDGWLGGWLTDYVEREG